MTVLKFKPEKPAPPRLARDDIGIFGNALVAARGQFTLATKTLCAEFGLAPRGPWIIGIVGKQPIAPNELADFFSVGRSLITAELAKLVDAGLVLQKKDEADGRRTILSLTPKGRQVYDRLGDELHAFMAQRLSGYSREDIMLCARLLSDFAKGGQTS